MTKNDDKKIRDNAIANIDSVLNQYQSNCGSLAFKEEDGHVSLTVDLKAVSLYKDCSNSALLNEDIYDFAEDISRYFDKPKDLTLNFLFADGTSLEDQERVKTIFKAHYASQYKALKEKLQKQLILALGFVFIGFILLTIHLAYTAYNSDSVYGEIIDIFAWVLIWEAAETLFVNSLDNQTDLKKYLLFYLAKPRTPSAK